MRIKTTTLYDFLGFIIVSSIALMIFVGTDMVEERNWSPGSSESVSICSEASQAGNAGKASVSEPDPGQTTMNHSVTLSKDPCLLADKSTETGGNGYIPPEEMNEEVMTAQVNEDIPDEQMSGESSMWNETGVEFYTGP